MMWRAIRWRCLPDLGRGGRIWHHDKTSEAMTDITDVNELMLIFTDL